MPDGKRKRRFSENKAKREWYAKWRQVRWSNHFFSGEMFNKIPSR
jgi:hypothetical protein